MSYKYDKKTPDQLEQIAVIILEKVPHRIEGCSVDIEGVIEDFGVTIIPRRGEFIACFKNVKASFNSIGGDADKTLRAIIKIVTSRFRISEYRGGRRARDLGLITDDDFQHNYPARLLF